MAFFHLIACFFFYFLLVFVDSTTFNATVALDGTGNYKSISDAIAAAPNNSNTRFYIHVTPGRYHEHLKIPSAKKFIALIGDNEFTTIIVDNRSNANGYRTSKSATMEVKGEHFMAQHLSFENSAGNQNGQAVAVLDRADFTTYYRCRFLSFQDTLYAKGRCQFFKECDIYGTVDFIFGDGLAMFFKECDIYGTVDFIFGDGLAMFFKECDIYGTVDFIFGDGLAMFFKECDIYGTVDFIFGDGLAMFQDCNIYARLPSNETTVTAQSKNKPSIRSGFSFQNCTVTVSPKIASSKIYLGRPWRQYSTVVFMESFLDVAYF